MAPNAVVRASLTIGTAAFTGFLLGSHISSGAVTATITRREGPSLTFDTNDAGSVVLGRRAGASLEVV